MPKPIYFSCTESIELSPEGIVNQILNLNNWTDFQGYGILPGIKKAEFETNPSELIGTRIRVTNTDNSSHVEEITEWIPDRRLVLHFQDFSAPLSRLASGFDEIWEFDREGETTHVVRSFEMYCKGAFAWPILKLISFFLRKAIALHLKEMKQNAQQIND